MHPMAASQGDWAFEREPADVATHPVLARALDVAVCKACGSLQAQGLLLLQLPALLQEHSYLPNVATCQVRLAPAGRVHQLCCCLWPGRCPFGYREARVPSHLAAAGAAGGPGLRPKLL